jgi:dihydrofolate reductase
VLFVGPQESALLEDPNVLEHAGRRHRQRLREHGVGSDQLEVDWRRTMATVSGHVVMSLDGYIAAPGDDMSWVFDAREPNDTADEVVAGTRAIVMGRRTYEVEDRDRRGIYGGRWSGALFVVTREPPATVPDWMTGTFVEGVEDAVAQARSAAGDGKVGLLGASMARQCLEAGLLDEIVVQLAPVRIGAGVRMFDSAGGRIKLGKTSVAESGQLADLTFRVLG